MNKLEQEKKLEDWHYAENDRIHKEFWGKAEFTEELRKLDVEFKKKFHEIFKRGE